MTTLTEQHRDPAWAWARYEPAAGRPWTLALAGHLHRRAGFGGTWEQLQRALRGGPQRTVDGLLRPAGDVAGFNRDFDKYEASADDARGVEDLRAWWLQRMMQSPHPLLEKMTLFWHGHFSVDGGKVNFTRLAQRHVALLRGQALGSFRELLRGIVHDAAVFLSLEAAINRKSQPNEQFPRWLMECYTVGHGNYTEADVRGAARAFAGWFVLQGELRDIPREHDTESKRILGQQGPFNSDDVVRILLEQPATAQHIVRKLYRWLISETAEPDARLIAPLAAAFGKDYDVGKVVEMMLRSNLFYSAAAVRQRVKCPVEFALGIVRALEGAVPAMNLAHDLGRLGQSLFFPPTTKGWTGGRDWINHATLAGRHNLAAAFLQATGGPYAGKLNPGEVAKKHGISTPQAAAKFFAELFVQDAAVAGEVIERDADKAARHAAYAVVTSPEFQLA
ncbi:MAG: DUF1800 domain-containing protein [Verrucomicrobia bacterium]|nr:DUF1800 domain-containing protein [Verrucomicrobiota bacterium]